MSSNVTPSTLRSLALGCVEPRDLDILVGKSKECRHHRGSRCFAVFVESYRQRYQLAGNKHKRGAVTLEMYQILAEQNLRFLKFNESLSGWKEVTAKEARDKITHALKHAQQKHSRSRQCPARNPSSSSRRSSEASLSSRSRSSARSNASSSLDWDQLLVQQQRNLRNSRVTMAQHTEVVTKTKTDDGSQTNTVSTVESEPLSIDVSTTQHVDMFYPSVNREAFDDRLPRIPTRRPHDLLDDEADTLLQEEIDKGMFDGFFEETALQQDVILANERQVLLDPLLEVAGSDDDGSNSTATPLQSNVVTTSMRNINAYPDDVEPLALDSDQAMVFQHGEDRNANRPEASKSADRNESASDREEDGTVLHTMNDLDDFVATIMSQLATDDEPTPHPPDSPNRDFGAGIP